MSLYLFSWQLLVHTICISVMFGYVHVNPPGPAEFKQVFGNYVQNQIR